MSNKDQEQDNKSVAVYLNPSEPIIPVKLFIFITNNDPLRFYYWWIIQ